MIVETENNIEYTIEFKSYSSVIYKKMDIIYMKMKIHIIYQPFQIKRNTQKICLNLQKKFRRVNFWC